ncbi:MAG: sulfatase, partial [Spirochaetaceae bacterium]
ILIDDMGARDLGCYGSTFYETPNIDKLATEGMLFTDAYAACPVCSPTRASILTGRYPASVGVTDWIDSQHGIHPAKGRLVDAPYVDHLPPQLPNLAGELSSRGYATWHVGKWHLGDEPYWPEKQGFDINVGGWTVGGPTHGYFSPWGFPTLSESPDGTYLTDRLTDETLELIRNRDKNRPFYLNLWYYSVHTPIEAKDEIIAKYEEKARRLGLDKQPAIAEGAYHPAEHKRHERIKRRVIQSDPVYAAMIETLDTNIGRVLASLEDEGIADNTLIILTSDNGGLSTTNGSPTCNLPLAEGKGWMYEGGVREPLLVRWPGRTPAGTTNHTVVTSPDFMPTLLEAVDGRAGGDDATFGDSGRRHRLPDGIEGTSILPVVTGETDVLDRGPVFWHYPHYGNQGGTPGTSVRHGRYKLIEFHEDGHVELFDLGADPGEHNELSAELPQVRDRLLEALRDWRTSVEARMPEPNPDYTPWPDRQPSGRFAVDTAFGRLSIEDPRV